MTVQTSTSQPMMVPATTTPAWNAQLIQRYDLSGPRYTSYPTAPQFEVSVGVAEVEQALARSNRAGRPLSLYFHVPFCSTVCYYCGCNKVITANRARAMPYLDRLAQEMTLYAAHLDSGRPVEQLHWGGGTPTYLSDAEKEWLMNEIARHFRLRGDDGGDYSIEIHPGETMPDSLDCLRSLGFNRLSMGIQDFDAGVQAATNRFNSVAQVRALVERARALGFHSIGFDLIYGLPRQSPQSFARTLDAVIALAPDRLSVFGYAHMPHLFRTQKQINADELPQATEKLDILRNTIARLLDAGYVYIGMDHFAKPGDRLALAQREGRLQRNFQGYTTHKECDLIAMGVSAISAIDDLYVQNLKDLGAYQRSVDGGEWPVFRGLRRSEDDRIRAAVIEALICHFTLDFAAIEQRFGIRCRDYFADELIELKPLAADGLLQLGEDGISITAAGRLLIRRVCMVFDAYLSSSAHCQKGTRPAPRYSRII